MLVYILSCLVQLATNPPLLAEGNLIYDTASHKYIKPSPVQ